MAILGLDVGTSGTKAVAFSLDGRMLARAYVEYPLHSPRPGWLVLKPAQVRSAIENTIAQAAEQARQAGDPVKAIGLTSQGEAFVPLAKSGKPLYDIQVTADNRCLDQVPKLRKAISPRQLFRLTGHSTCSMYSLPKFMWMKERAKAVWRRAAKVLCMEDFASWVLGVEPAISQNLASRTQVFDVHKKAFSPRLLKLAGLNAGQLARPLPSGSVAGLVPPRTARKLNLGTDVAVCVGGHDQSCGAFGAGVRSERLAVYGTGTVECITLVWGGYPPETAGWEKHHLCCYPFVQEGKYCSLIFNLTGGNLLKWYRDTLGAAEVAQARKERVDPYEVICRDLPDAPSRVMFLPHFTTTGTPWLDATTVGSLTGLRLSTTRKEIVKAILESVTYEMGLCWELFGKATRTIRRIFAVGGGARSPEWVQIKADVLNRPITRLAVDEVVALGAALLAGLGAGLIRDIDAETRLFVREGETITPQPALVKRYAERLAIYRDLYPALRDVNHRVAALT